MGLIRDRFLIKLKSEFECACYQDLVSLIPENHVYLFSILWNQFQNISDMINTKNIDQVISCIKNESNKNEKSLDDLLYSFFGLYREKDCLQQILRKTFFDTVLIIQNSYSDRGVNIFQVLEKDQFINIIISDKKQPINDCISIPQVKEDDVFDRMIANVNAEGLISENTWNSEDPKELKYLRTKIVNMKEESVDLMHNPR